MAGRRRLTAVARANPSTQSPLLNSTSTTIDGRLRELTEASLPGSPGPTLDPIGMHLRQATAADASVISEVVQASFTAHIAADWELPARQEFMAETRPERLALKCANQPFACYASTTLRW